MIPNNLLHFATFEGSQLQDFDINPMTVALYIPNAEEHTLRLQLQKPPFNNAYCTTYSGLTIASKMSKYNLIPITIDELLTKHKGKPFSDFEFDSIGVLQSIAEDLISSDNVYLTGIGKSIDNSYKQLKIEQKLVEGDIDEYERNTRILELIRTLKT